MTSSTGRSSLPHDGFILTPEQQEMLDRAMRSRSTGNPASLQSNTTPLVPNSPTPPIGYDVGHYDLATSMYPGLTGMMGADLPGSTSVNSSSRQDDDGADKRRHPDDDGEEQKQSAKRRGGQAKVHKKPGRKPITVEPSSKRKAQNRAAQRAFRERKEQHLRELETKVQELEQISQSATTENSKLRAQMELMVAELDAFERQLALHTTTPPSAHRRPVSGPSLFDMSDVTLPLDFSPFGFSPRSHPNGTVPDGGTKGVAGSQLVPSTASALPTTQSNDHSTTLTGSPEKLEPQARDLAKLYGLPANSLQDGTCGNQETSRLSLDSGTSSFGGSHSGSPNSSRHSNGCAPSSCGTSPEPLIQSPGGYKRSDTLATIGEEQTGAVTADSTASFGSLDTINHQNWILQQNGGQFDPQLYLAWREPQDDPFSFDAYLNEAAFDADFTTPYNMAPGPHFIKKDLCAEIDERKEKEDTIPAVNGRFVTCDNLVKTLKGHPAGDFDVDGLCNDLWKKAKCGGAGPVLEDNDFRDIVTKHICSPGDEGKVVADTMDRETTPSA